MKKLLQYISENQRNKLETWSEPHHELAYHELLFSNKLQKKEIVL